MYGRDLALMEASLATCSEVGQRLSLFDCSPTCSRLLWCSVLEMVRGLGERLGDLSTRVLGPEEDTVFERAWFVCHQPI